MFGVGLQSDAKEHQKYPLVTLSSAAKPIPQNRRPPRNGHGPEWAASDAGLGDNALNSSTCPDAQTRGRVAASAMRPKPAHGRCRRVARRETLRDAGRGNPRCGAQPLSPF